MAKCEKCGEKVKGLFDVTDFDEYGVEVGRSYCEKCYGIWKEEEMVRIENKAEKDRSMEEKRVVMKKSLEEMIIVTTDKMENKHIEKYFGFISAEVVLGTGIISESLAGISDIFGKESKAFDKKINTSKNIILQKLKVRCAELGGNAVIGAKYDLETIGKNMIMAVLSGTAVHIV